MPMPEGRVIAAISPNFCCESGWSKIEASQSFGLIEVSRPEKVMVRPFEMMELLASVINRLSSPSSLLHHCRPATLCFLLAQFLLFCTLSCFCFLFSRPPLFRLVCRYIPREHAPRPDPPLESRAPNTAPFHSPAPICFTRIQCWFSIVFRDVAPFPLTSADPSHFFIQRRPAERKASTWRREGGSKPKREQREQRWRRR